MVHSSYLLKIKNVRLPFELKCLNMWIEIDLCYVTYCTFMNTYLSAHLAKAFMIKINFDTHSILTHTISLTESIFEVWLATVARI